MLYITGSTYDIDAHLPHNLLKLITYCVYLDAIKSEKSKLRKKWGHAKEEKSMILQKSGLFAKIIPLPKSIHLYLMRFSLPLENCHF